MDVTSLLLVGAAGAVGCAINAAAGGGSFISFPTLVFLGVPVINAQATNATAMWIGASGSITGYRKELAERSPRHYAALVTSLLGGLAGAVILLHTPQQTFTALLPWLLLISTAVFAAGPYLNRLAKRPVDLRELPYAALPGLFVICAYGGFFSGGQGLLILAFLGLVGMTDLKRMNALKVIFQFINNMMPAIAFGIGRALVWDVAIAMSIGALLGGYFGARVARRVPAAALRVFIIGVGVAMTIVFFTRAYGRPV
jgi:uncharacterized membrane protein YfcA